MRSLLIVLFVSFYSVFAIGQDMPMKNDMVYYSFEHKMNNKKNCLVKIYGQMKTLTDMQTKLRELQTNKNKKWSVKQAPTCMYALWGQSYDTICVTKFNAMNGAAFKLLLPSDYKGTNLLNLGKKKLVKHHVEAQASIEFISSNEYKLVFKGFTYIAIYMEGNQARNEIIPFEDLFLKNDKDNRSIFGDVDYFVRGIDSALQEILERSIKVDELD